MDKNDDAYVENEIIKKGTEIEFSTLNKQNIDTYITSLSIDEYPGGSEPSDSDGEEQLSEFQASCESPHYIEMEYQHKNNKNSITNPLSYKKLSYNAVKQQVNKYYNLDTIHKYSSSLDIIVKLAK